jgi:hypothetical protein
MRGKRERFQQNKLSLPGFPCVLLGPWVWFENFRFLRCRWKREQSLVEASGPRGPTRTHGIPGDPEIGQNSFPCVLLALFGSSWLPCLFLWPSSDQDGAASETAGACSGQG